MRRVRPITATGYAGPVIFGENLLALLVLAIGAALAFGNLMALVRPRHEDQIGEGELARPPLVRSLAMIVLGLLAAIWALASLATADPDEGELSQAVSPSALVAAHE